MTLYLYELVNNHRSRQVINDSLEYWVRRAKYAYELYVSETYVCIIFSWSTIAFPFEFIIFTRKKICFNKFLLKHSNI